MLHLGPNIENHREPRVISRVEPSTNLVEDLEDISKELIPLRTELDRAVLRDIKSEVKPA